MDRDALWKMELFVAVVETGTLAAAARRLAVTPSAVSKRLAKAEQGLGVRLLARTTRNLRVTDAGARYYEHAKKVLRAVEETEGAVTAAATSISGTLRVTAPVVLGQELVAPVAMAFLAQHADVHLELDLSDRFVDLIADPFDLAIRVASRLPASGLGARRLGTLKWHIVASPAYLAKSEPLSRPDDLAKHACLDLAHGVDRGRWRLSWRGRELRIFVHGPLVCSSLVGLRQAALAGLGVALLPGYLVADELAEGRLVRVLPAAGTERRHAFAVLPSREFVPPRVRAFIDALAKAFGRDGAR